MWICDMSVDTLLGVAVVEYFLIPLRGKFGME